MMQWISEATTATFEQEVLARSMQLVVLVDFWAPWCSPCRALGPLLEEAVAAREGLVWLVKVNTDVCPELAEQFGIRGIPAVKAFYRGELVNEFVGVQDRHSIELFLDQVCPAPEQRNLEQAETLLARGDGEQAKVLLQPMVSNPRWRDQALLLLAKIHLAAGELILAKETLQEVPSESLVAEQAAALSTRLELYQVAQQVDASTLCQALEQDPPPIMALWQGAAQAYHAGDRERALSLLLDIIKRDRSFQEDGARRAMLALFDELGADDDLVREYRRQLQIYL